MNIQIDTDSKTVYIKDMEIKELPRLSRMLEEFHIYNDSEWRITSNTGEYNQRISDYFTTVFKTNWTGCTSENNLTAETNGKY